MIRLNVPSETQARRLAGLFADGARYISVSEHMPPTDRVLLKHDWIAATGETGTYPSGGEYSIYKISDVGLRALEQYLFERRCRPAGRVASGAPE